MASTNEDAVVLATATVADGRLLLMRHLPDRGTVEIGWWRRDGTELRDLAPAFEIAAETTELQALAELCRRAADWWAQVADQEEIAVVEVGEGAQLVAARRGDELELARHPEPDDRIRLPRDAVESLLSHMLPAATERLTTLGFGLAQPHG